MRIGLASSLRQTGLRDPDEYYVTISALLEGRLIQEVGERADSEMGPERRRYYRLTSAGSRLARACYVNR